MLKGVFHPKTSMALDQAISSNHHVIALIGPYGAGKGFAAQELAKGLLGEFYAAHRVYTLVPTQNSIGIDAVRTIQAQLKLKASGTAPIRRVIIIEDAQYLTIEAQNALLKTLEETTEETRIIMTLTHKTAVLPTVMSRVQAVEVLPLSQASCQSLAATVAAAATPEETKKAALISGGYAGLFVALLQEPSHLLVESVRTAKNFLSSSQHARLLMVGQLAGDKSGVELFIFALKRVLSSAMRNSAKPEQVVLAAKKLQRVYSYEASLTSNPNLKLLLTDMALGL
jgi:DNA polymerase III delta prime subunit